MKNTVSEKEKMVRKAQDAFLKAFCTESIGDSNSYLNMGTKAKYIFAWFDESIENIIRQELSSARRENEMKNMKLGYDAAITHVLQFYNVENKDLIKNITDFMWGYSETLVIEKLMEEKK